MRTVKAVAAGQIRMQYSTVNLSGTANLGVGAGWSSGRRLASWRQFCVISVFGMQ